MSVAPLRLFHVAMPNPEATIYTSPGGVVLRKLVVVNTSGGAATASISINGKRVMAAKNIPANDFVPLVLGVPIGAGELVTALASIAGPLVVLGTGFTF